MIALSACKPKDASQSSKMMEEQGPALLIFPGEDTVYKGDFEYVYQKNNGGWDAAAKHTQEQYKEYLDLYINFKRKVLEAEANGLHETDAFKNEFEGYRKQLAQPYLVDKSVQEELIEEAYERSKVVVSAAHILFLAGPETPPADTLKAYQKALSIRDSIVNHDKDFSEMAKRHSEDPSAKSNLGDLGYFSVFDMVYPFETGAFNTPLGTVSEPVRSGYGYHLIKVNDRMDNPGKKTAAHLIVRVGPQYSTKTDEEAEARINEIHKLLEEGSDWNEMVRKYSDDPNTTERGGDLGKGRLIPEMENAKRSLGNGDFSPPFQTSFGYHILKITDVEEVKTFEEAKPEIKNRISRDARSTLSRERLIAKVKRENDFRSYPDNIALFAKHIEDQGQTSAYARGFWRPVDSLMGNLYDVRVYSLGKGANVVHGTVRDFINYYTKERKGMDGVNAQQATDRFMNSYFEEAALDYEEMQLPKKHREYRELLKEYRDGILLFTLTEDKVWRKAVEDTTGLQNYFNSHKADFMASERVVVNEYITDGEAAIKQVEGMLKEGKTEQEISDAINVNSSLKLTVRTQTYEKGKSSSVDQLFGKAIGYISPVDVYGNNRYRIFVVKENLPAGQKEFADAKSEAITQYQNYLEAEWLKELKEKYPVTVEEKVIEKLFK